MLHHDDLDGTEVKSYIDEKKQFLSISLLLDFIIVATFYEIKSSNWSIFNHYLDF